MTFLTPRFTRPRRALVLVLVLWLIVVMGVIATSLAYEVQVNSKLALIQKRQFVAHTLARSAIAIGMTHLQNDILMDHEENPEQMFDAYCDVWAQPDRKEKEIEVKMGEGTYELEVNDEEGKLNINFANQKVMKAMLLLYDYEEDDAEMIANALVDFRDPDDMSLGEAGTPEDEYYSGLLGQRFTQIGNTSEAPIYTCPNENFLTTDQLLDVFGIEPEVYYGFDPATEEAKELRIRNEIASGRTPAVRKERSRKGELGPLRDVLTVHGSGKVNINSAPVEVLTILFYAGNDLGDLPAARAAAESVVKARGSDRRGSSPSADDAFKSAADLAKIPGVDVGALTQGGGGAGGGAIQLAFRSETFSVTGIGRVGSIKKTITALVSRTLDTYNPDDARLMNTDKGFRAGRRGGGFANKKRTVSTRGKKGEDDNFIRIPAIRVLQWTE